MPKSFPNRTLTFGTTLKTLDFKYQKSNKLDHFAALCLCGIDLSKIKPKTLDIAYATIVYLPTVYSFVIPSTVEELNSKNLKSKNPI